MTRDEIERLAAEKAAKARPPTVSGFDSADNGRGPEAMPRDWLDEQEDARATVERLIADDEADDDLRSHLLAELYADPTMLAPPVALVERFLYAGAFTILSGQPKAGKSTLLSILCAALAGGVDFYTGEPRPARRVLYCSLEEQPSDTIRRLERYGAPGALVRLFTRSQVRSIDDIARELQAAERRGVPFDVTLIDSLRRLAVLHDVKDATASMQMRGLLEQVVDLVRETERTVGLLHHQRRPKPGDRGGAFADSGDIAAVPDCLIEMDAMPGTRRRFTPMARWDSEPFTLELTSDRYVLADTTPALETAVDMTRVIQYVREHHDCSRRKAAKMAPGQQADRMAHIDALVRSRVLIDVGTPYRSKLRLGRECDVETRLPL